MTRIQYISPIELNEILGVSTYTDSDLIHIYEASEFINYYLFNFTDEVAKWDTSNTPDLIKLATAYQFKYMETNDLFDEYLDGNFSLGSFSLNGQNDTQSNNLSKTAHKYLVQSGYMRRFV